MSAAAGQGRRAAGRRRVAEGLLGLTLRAAGLWAFLAVGLMAAGLLGAPDGRPRPEAALVAALR